MSDIVRAFDTSFGPGRLRPGVPLAPMTTFRVGGPAEFLFEARGTAEIVRALMLARQAHVPVTILGGGSNMLVSDRGVRGLVIRPTGGEIRMAAAGGVDADAAVSMNGLVRWTILRGLAGLEAWAGTPGTVGGAIAGNAHFGGELIGDRVVDVRIAGPDGTVTTLSAGAMDFGYDRSRLQTSGEVLLSAVFRVEAGAPGALRARARASLAYRKKTQPLAHSSAGCIFRNPMPDRDAVPAGMPWSAGALVDRAGLKGRAVGGARVSLTHGNFIVNEGGATAADIRQLIDLCRTAVKDRFGVELREEIVYLGPFERPG